MLSYTDDSFVKLNIESVFLVFLPNFCQTILPVPDIWHLPDFFFSDLRQHFCLKQQFLFKIRLQNLAFCQPDIWQLQDPGYQAKCQIRLDKSSIGGYPA